MCFFSTPPLKRIRPTTLSFDTSSLFTTSSLPRPHQICSSIEDIDRAQQVELQALDTLIRSQAGALLKSLF